MIVLGIDPGLSGAVAVVRDRLLLAVEDLYAEDVIGQPVVKRRLCAPVIAQQLRRLRSEHSDGAELVVIERVAAMPKQGVASVFCLGDSAGLLRGVLGTLELPTHYVTPQAWKKHFGLIKGKGEGKDKGASRTRATEIFPASAHYWRRVADHNRAEAALLARFGWETMA